MKQLLRLPHVTYDLAVDAVTGVRAVTCRTCAPGQIRLGLGNQFLHVLDPSYPNGTKYHVRQHTVDAVAEVLNHIGRPPPGEYCVGMPKGIRTAMDVFVGYTMLDAWIANQDRHHENWGALLDGGDVYLAPTFDHGASLARNLLDSERAERLSTSDKARQIPQFVAKARSAFYADLQQKKAMLTLDAWRAFALRSPHAAKIWLEQLQSISDEAINGVLMSVPPERMTDVCRRFTMAVLQVNRRRILKDERE